jgi:hypothetical protein
MRVSRSGFLLSPSDLTGYLACPHLTTLALEVALEVALGERKRPYQRYRAATLVDPVGEEHMYYAAMNSTSCQLTPLGRHYWHMAEERRFLRRSALLGTSTCRLRRCRSSSSRYMRSYARASAAPCLHLASSRS